MKTIKEPRKNIALLWRRPEPVQTTYRAMKYLLKAQTDDGLLLYNVVTSEMVLLDESERRVFEGSPAEYTAKMDEMVARHYLVKEGFDEARSVRELRALMKKLDPEETVTGFTILPTTECNARCYYCFESNHKRCTLTDELTNDIVEYIALKCKGKPIEITWFGGEPLIGKRQISQICSGLKGQDIAFSSSMISNAYLFDERLVQTAKEEWNLKVIQITLDGTERVYNETKAYVNPKDNPYERVLNNIESFLDNGISVNVRLNVTDRNAADLSNLIDELSSRFGGRKQFSCYSHAVYDGVGFEPLEYDDHIREMIDAQLVALDTKLREKGFLGSLTRLPNLRIIQCMADNDRCRQIYPDGTIGKCENRSSDDSIGDIYNDITNIERNEMYKTTVDFPECDDCCLFPYCVNLEVCPETGKCSRIKLDWKVSRYNNALKKLYLQYKQNDSGSDTDDITLVECES